MTHSPSEWPWQPRSQARHRGLEQCHLLRSPARKGTARAEAAPGPARGGRLCPDTWPCGAVPYVWQTHRPTTYAHGAHGRTGRGSGTLTPTALTRRHRPRPPVPCAHGSAQPGELHAHGHTRVCPPGASTRAREQGGHGRVGGRRRCSVAQVTTGPAHRPPRMAAAPRGRAGGGLAGAAAPGAVSTVTPSRGRPRPTVPGTELWTLCRAPPMAAPLLPREGLAGGQVQDGALATSCCWRPRPSPDDGGFLVSGARPSLASAPGPQKPPGPLSHWPPWPWCPGARGCTPLASPASSPPAPRPLPSEQRLGLPPPWRAPRQRPQARPCPHCWSCPALGPPRYSHGPWPASTRSDPQTLPIPSSWPLPRR